MPVQRAPDPRDGRRGRFRVGAVRDRRRLPDGAAPIFVGIPPAVAVATQTRADRGRDCHERARGDVGATRSTSKLGSVLDAWKASPARALGVWVFALMRRAGQLGSSIVISYVTLFTAIGGLMLVGERARVFWCAARRGPGRCAAPASMPPISAGRCGCGSTRSSCTRASSRSSSSPRSVGFAGALLGIGGGLFTRPGPDLPVPRAGRSSWSAASQLQMLGDGGRRRGPARRSRTAPSTSCWP